MTRVSLQNNNSHDMLMTTVSIPDNNRHVSPCMTTAQTTCWWHESPYRDNNSHGVSQTGQQLTRVSLQDNNWHEYPYRTTILRRYADDMTLPTWKQLTWGSLQENNSVNKLMTGVSLQDNNRHEVSLHDNNTDDMLMTWVSPIGQPTDTSLPAWQQHRRHADDMSLPYWTTTDTSLPAWQQHRRHADEMSLPIGQQSRRHAYDKLMDDNTNGWQY